MLQVYLILFVKILFLEINEYGNILISKYMQYLNIFINKMKRINLLFVMDIFWIKKIELKKVIFVY